jgi:Insertion element 4 transposase N-terminal/Transposase DDE domain
MPAGPAGGAGRRVVVPGLGVLMEEISPALVEEVVASSGCREKRVRVLPAVVVVYFVLGCCLLSGEDSMGPPGYRSVWRSLTHGVRHLAGAGVPSRSALCRARQRLGAKPLEMLFDRLRGPLADAGRAGVAGAFAFGLRVVAWDGTGIDVPGSAANAAAFGGPAGGGPMLRLMTLMECGTHAIIDAAFDGWARASEMVLARRLLHALDSGMLLLADRNFRGWELWGLARSAGAQLCWRVRASQVFTALEYLPDGSFTAIMPTPAEARRGWAARRAGRPGPAAGHLVRIIDYTVTVTPQHGGEPRTEAFRLVTSLLDWRQAPAAELAALYHHRWEAEGGFAELKTRLRGAGFTLRSRTPEMACQELQALLAVCQALTTLEYQAARQGRLDPARISFTTTVRITRDHARTQQRTRTPRGLARARRHAITDLLGELLGPRRPRSCPRVKKPPRNTYPRRTTTPATPPGPLTYNTQITRPPPPAQPP